MKETKVFSYTELQSLKKIGTKINVVSVIRSNALFLQRVLIKQLGLASQYRMQVVSNMFTEYFKLCPSKANTYKV